MAIFCRITGKSRGLPKPNYFPLLPPISSSDAKRFCRITGKSYGLPSHHYIPVLMGKPKNKKSRNGKRNIIIAGYTYFFPCLEEAADLNKILDDKPESEIKYVYNVKEKKCGLLFPAKLEAAVRDGDVSDVMLGQDLDSVLFKLKRGYNISVDVKIINAKEIPEDQLQEGEGFIRSKKKVITSELTKQLKGKFEKLEKTIVNQTHKSTKLEIEEKIAPSYCAIKEHVIVVDKLPYEEWKWNDFEYNNNGEPVLTEYPSLINISPKNIDLNISTPGIIQQPQGNFDSISLELSNPVEPFKPLNEHPSDSLINAVLSMDKENAHKTLSKNIESIFKDHEDLLPNMADIIKLIDLLQSGTEIINEENGEVISGKIFEIEGRKKFVIGQTIETSEGPLFIPGQTVTTSFCDKFIPGFTVNTSEGIKLLAGITVTDSDMKDKYKFVVGQIILTRDGEKFVQGQGISGLSNIKFCPGQTIVNNNEMKFIPGQINGEEFIVGQLFETDDGIQFICGQTIEKDDRTIFIPGQTTLIDNCWQFVPGKTIHLSEFDSKFIPGITIPCNCVTDEMFIPGQYVTVKGESVFIPGLNENDEKFTCGVTMMTPSGEKFIHGQIVQDDKKHKFIPGETKVVNSNELEFLVAHSKENLISDDVDKFFKEEQAKIGDILDGVFGHMIQSKHGIEFFPGTSCTLPAEKVVPGKLIRDKEPRFVPGIISDGNFIPGQMVVTESGEQFIPGQVVETTEGPKFVPGHIVKTKLGQKFIPGQTIITEDGRKFIPGQIVETKAGPTFIPGQVIYTDGKEPKFVPGQVVETISGPRFVPGRVVESGDRVSFIPGQVVETSEGLKYVAPDLAEDDFDDSYTVQGFEISKEELNLLNMNALGSSKNEQIEMTIDSKMLRQLSEAGMSIGRQIQTDIPDVDVHSTPSINAACILAEKMKFDPVTTAKVSQIFSAVIRLSKFGAIKGESKDIVAFNSMIQHIQNSKNEQEALILLSEEFQKNKDINIIENVDSLHSYIISDVSPLRKISKICVLKDVVKGEEPRLSADEVVKRFETVLEDDNETVCNALKYLSEIKPEIIDTIVDRVAECTEEIDSEKAAVETVHRAIVSTVRDVSEMNIVDLMKDTENLELKDLILEAVALAKALEMHETAIGLLEILSNPKCTDILAGDRITLEILRRLTIMKQLAQKRPELLIALKKLQQDPYTARTDPLLKQLVRESGALLVIPDEEITSESVPLSLLFQQNSLAMEDLLTKMKRVHNILIIIKQSFQAIIPREAAHSVLTGTVPYVVLDEKGIHHFKPKHVFTALRLPKFAKTWYKMYQCEIIN